MSQRLANWAIQVPAVLRVGSAIHMSCGLFGLERRCWMAELQWRLGRGSRLNAGKKPALRQRHYTTTSYPLTWQATHLGARPIEWAKNPEGPVFPPFFFFAIALPPVPGRDGMPMSSR